MVAVASPVPSLCKRVKSVNPMFFDRPTTQTCLPNVGMLHLLMISNIPRGVAGIIPGSPAQYLPVCECVCV